MYHFMCPISEYKAGKSMKMVRLMIVWILCIASCTSSSRSDQRAKWACLSLICEGQDSIGIVFELSDHSIRSVNDIFRSGFYFDDLEELRRVRSVEVASDSLTWDEQLLSGVPGFGTMFKVPRADTISQSDPGFVGPHIPSRPDGRPLYRSFLGRVLFRVIGTEEVFMAVESTGRFSEVDQRLRGAVLCLGWADVKQKFADPTGQLGSLQPDVRPSRVAVVPGFLETFKEGEVPDIFPVATRK